MPAVTPRIRTYSPRVSGQAKRSPSTTLTRSFTRGIRKNKVCKEFWLDPKLLQTVKEELGVATAREGVEMALDLIVFRKELVKGVHHFPKVQDLRQQTVPYREGRGVAQALGHGDKALSHFPCRLQVAPK